MFLSSKSGDAQDTRPSDLAPATLDRPESPSKTCPQKCRHSTYVQSSLTGFRHARLLQSAWNRQSDVQDEPSAGQHLACVRAIGGGTADLRRLFVPMTTLPVAILVIGPAPFSRPSSPGSAPGSLHLASPMRLSSPGLILLPSPAFSLAGSVPVRLKPPSWKPPASTQVSRTRPHHPLYATLSPSSPSQ